MSLETDSVPEASQLETVHGRPVPVKAQYSLPIDAEEFRRLDLQHECQKRTIGGLYAVPELVRSALEPKEGSITRILDIGTGSGAWAIDMAEEFPHCEFTETMAFIVGDVNLPLPFETASVNMVHARLVDTGIEHYPKWLSEVSRILGPYGVYLVIGPNNQMILEDGTNLPLAAVGEPGYTGVANVFATANKYMESRRDGGLPSERWMTLMKANGNFSDMAKIEGKLVPIGPWPNGLDENARIASELMKQNVILLIRAFKTILSTTGCEEAIVDRWIKDAVDELSEPRLRLYCRFESAWCTRSADDWKPYHETDII